jgi:hypothetical protein
MANIKRGNNGVAYRYVKSGLINTLYGKDIRRCQCKTCKRSLPESEFYHRKNGDPLRDCISCDDARRLLAGKIQRRREKGVYVDKELQPITTLESFI